MLNDNIINFYLSYLLTQYIDRALEVAHIDKSVGVEYVRKRALSTSGEDMEEETEDPLQSTLHSIFDRFEIATTFLYPQLHRLSSVCLAAISHNL